MHLDDFHTYHDTIFQVYLVEAWEESKEKLLGFLEFLATG